MADQEKKMRTNALKNFTRSVGTLEKLITDSVPSSIILPQVTKLWDKVCECWEKLESAQDSFIEKTDIDVDTHKDGFQYLDAPTVTYNDLIIKYSTFCSTAKEAEKVDGRKAEEDRRKADEEERKKIEADREVLEHERFEREKKEKFEVEKTEFEFAVDTFQRMNIALRETLEVASGEDKRSELQKYNDEFTQLKDKYIQLSGTTGVDMTEVKEKFIEHAEKTFAETQKWLLSELKDTSKTSGGKDTPVACAKSSKGKTESVPLPSFQGDSKTSPFLKFPVWKSQWDILIQDYDKKYHTTLLCKYLDDTACNKFVGWEDNYEEAMKRLADYYGNPVKVVQWVMKEVNKPEPISDGDYQGLLSYSVVLETNYNRLKSMNRKNDMSNISTMTEVMRKFPRPVREKWNEYFCQQDSSTKSKPFEEFVMWLGTQREMWERMAATEIPKGRSTKGFYVDHNDGGSFRGKCHSCGEQGHHQRDCSNRKYERTRTPTPRKKPTVKKFWCALHKDEGSRKCFSNSCQELRKTEVNRRIQLLKENNDCSICCGDHKAEDCTKKDRQCGGGKENRGCSKNHHVHELLCKEAKLCLTVVNVMSTASDEDGVVLSIMRIKIKAYTASVFWDLGSTSNFIREEFAKMCGFSGKTERLTVKTLGNVITDYTVISYHCSMKDTNGVSREFRAYGMDSLTGGVTRIGLKKIKKLFPHISHDLASDLTRLQNVDVLIGMPHPSWHPERDTQAKGGGDFWLFRGVFGACVGGRHPEIIDNTQKSNSLFTVVDTFHSQVVKHQDRIISHELEFCPSRVKNYYSSHAHIVSEHSITGVSEVLEVDESPSSIVTSEETFQTHVVSEDSVTGVSEVLEGDESQSSIVTSEETFAIQSVNEESPSVTAHEGDSSSESLSQLSALALEFVPQPSTVAEVSNKTSISRIDDTFGANKSQPIIPSERTSSVNLVTMKNIECECRYVEEGANLASGYCQEDNSLHATKNTVPNHTVNCNHSKVGMHFGENQFFEAEALGVTPQPRCGGCKCGKCSILGAKFSFKEQQEYDIILKNLSYDEENKRWVTEYPWSCERSTLPRNHKAAMQNLISLEHRLSKDPEMAKQWQTQIQEMVNRTAAIKLSEEVVDAWEGDYHFLPLVGVKGKRGLRVCFDASRKQNRHPSMNDCLFKGPDRFMNNLLSVIIGFRNGRVGCAADISKFHNRVYLDEKDMHMQRFYWRDMKTDQKPSVYAVQVNNFGVKPANCIATAALHNSADHFSEQYPIESAELKNQIYVDDMFMTATDKEQALLKTSRVDEIGEYAGMPNKGWTYSGDNVSEGIAIGTDEEAMEEKVLGIVWMPKSDMFKFNVCLKLKQKSGSKEVIVTCKSELDGDEWLITRRIMLSNVGRIFDPIGLLAPLLLEAKLLLRESWCVPGLGWDDSLPPDQANRWSTFMTSVLSLKDVKFHRSLWPEGRVVGLPILIIFSDGAALAFGAVAYIRWELHDGGFWSRIIMSKCKIAPKHIVSVPRMELNGALTGNRIKNFIIKETNFKFSKTYQFVDSSTVLGYVHKQCGVFNVYEGLRVAEIQSTNTFIDGKLENWAWVSGANNPADWCTKPHLAKDLILGGFWESGPQFLQEDEASWPIKFSYRTDRLEGEVQLRKQIICTFVNLSHPDFLGRLLHRGSSLKKMIRVLAWMLRAPDVIIKKKQFTPNSLSSAELNIAKQMLIKYSQKELHTELKNAVENGKGKYRRLAPVIDKKEIWRVGARVKNHVPFTFDSQMPVILPPNHRFTLLAMEESHRFSHSGQDGTVSRFRARGYWTVRAGVIAKTVKNACVPCRKVTGKTLTQLSGEIPADRILQPMAWGQCQLDLFGPFHCRGDVNPRTTKKIWGLVIEDQNSGAVYIDVVTDYSTVAVLMTMRRFGSLRGWPGAVYSDPGSQLESASGKLELWWKKMERTLATFAGSKNFRWETSPADSPWRQGKVERRIAIIKKHIKHAIGDSRITPLELQTILMEIADICNERPITAAKPREDGTYCLVTPNQLLMGRSGNQLPDDGEIAEDLGVTSRYRLINHVTTMFWQRWSAEVSPSLIVRQKWHVPSRNLQKGDVVMIAEPSKLKSKYKMGIIEDVKVSQDDIVRSAVVRYNNVQNTNNKLRAFPVRVTRSVQRLVLILPVEEQSSPLNVMDDAHQVSICAFSLRIQ